MLNFFIGLGIGYFLKSFLAHKVEHDMLLTWDPSALGWRSVPHGSELSPGKRYVAAIEIKLNNDVHTR